MSGDRRRTEGAIHEGNVTTDERTRLAGAALGAVAAIAGVSALAVLGNVFASGGRSNATYVLIAVLLLVVAGLFATAAYLSFARTPKPRAWLRIGVAAVAASFFPYAAFVGPVGFVLNAGLTALAAGCLYAFVRAERRLAEHESAGS